MARKGFVQKPSSKSTEVETEDDDAPAAKATSRRGKAKPAPVAKKAVKKAAAKPAKKSAPKPMKAQEKEHKKVMGNIRKNIKEGKTSEPAPKKEITRPKKTDKLSGNKTSGKRGRGRPKGYKMSQESRDKSSASRAAAWARIKKGLAPKRDDKATIKRPKKSAMPKSKAGMTKRPKKR